MRPISLPDVAYDATAVRPGWSDLPESVRAAIGARLGSPVIAVRSAGGGFTRAFAAVLETAGTAMSGSSAADGSAVDNAATTATAASDTAAGGSAVTTIPAAGSAAAGGSAVSSAVSSAVTTTSAAGIAAAAHSEVTGPGTAGSRIDPDGAAGKGGVRVFVKAAPLSDPVAQWYAREAAITESLPREVTAARPLWTMTDSDWFVLCLEAVDGRIPALPWSQTDLDAALRTWSAAATALAHPSPRLLEIGLPTLPEILREEMSWWSLIAKRREPMPEPARATIAPQRLAELAALEQALPGLTAGDAMLHGDLRIDNVLVDVNGRAWICDWTWPCLGVPWFDTVTLLVSAYASGLDTDRVLRAWGAPDEGVDGALAALAGYWLVRAGDGPSSASPHSRQHQRFSGEQALAWLAERRGWAPGGAGDGDAPRKRGWWR